MRRRIPRPVLIFVALVMLAAGASFTIQAVSAALIPIEHSCGGG